MIYLFDYNKIMQENTVVHCDTEEKAIKLLEWADSKGLKWGDGDSYIVYTIWDRYKQNTVYEVFKGKFGSFGWHAINNYTILTYEEVLLNDFDLIYKIETGDFGNRCNVEHFNHHEVERKTVNLNSYNFEIWDMFKTLINSTEIFIGENEGQGGFNELNKTEILSAFDELAIDKKWKIKVIYDGKEYIYDYKTLPDKIEKVLKLEEIDNDLKIIRNTLNKKGEEDKMNGKKADVKVTVGFLDKATGELEIQQRYHTEICLVSKDKRKCAVEGGSYDDVICLEVDGVEEMPYLKPIVIKKDEREEKLKLIVEQCKLNNKILLGLIDKTPEIEGKLVELQRKIANLSSYVSYELDWAETK